MTNAKLDPITLEMFWRRLNSTVDELAATLKRTPSNWRPKTRPSIRRELSEAVKRVGYDASHFSQIERLATTSLAWLSTS